MNQTLLYSLIMAFGVLISAVSQLLLKKAAQKEYSSPLREYLNPLVIGAYSIFFLATLCTILAYKVVPLSLGAVIESTSYIYVTALSAVFYKERISPKKLIALVLIISGIVVFSVF